MKQVQVDSKTVIEVDERISDECARREYLEKLRVMKIESPTKGHRSRGGTAHKNIPRQDIVFKGDNTNRRVHWRSSNI